MHLTDTYALATVLPVLAIEFDVSPIQLKHTLTVYLFVSAVMIPASGWLADRWGSRRVYVIAVVAFLLGSIVCALSNTVAQLVAARALQGIGGGVMVPVARLIVLRNSDRSELVRTLNWFAIPAIIGPLVGPPIAGLLAEHASWRWVFIINIPIGVIGLVTALTLVPRMRHPSPGHFDLPGVALVGLAILGIMGVADTVGTSTLPGPVFLALVVLTGILITMAVRYSRRAPNPILNLRLFALSSFRASLLGGGLMRLSLGATPFLLPIMLQTVFGWSPSAAGLVLLWAATGAIVGRLVAPRFIARFGFRSQMAVTGVAAALAVTIPAFYTTATPALLIFFVAMATNILFTSHYTATNALVFAEVPDELTNAGSTLSVIVQQITQSLGISIGALALYLGTLSSGGEIQSGSFLLPFLVLGSAGLLALPIYLSLPASVGHDMRGQSK